MEKKISKIILIDDDYPTNLYNSIILNEGQLANEIISFEDSMTALDYLIKEKNQLHGIILLDINMPRMNGWEFLDQIQKYNELVDRVKIIMHSASQNPDHIQKSKEYKCVKGYLTKPLKIDKLLEIL